MVGHDFARMGKARRIAGKAQEFLRDGNAIGALVAGDRGQRLVAHMLHRRKFQEAASLARDDREKASAAAAASAMPTQSSATLRA